MGIEVPQDVKDFQAQLVQSTLDVFERMLAQHKGDFLVSDQPTIADLQLFYELLDLNITQTSWAKYANISAWHDKMLTIPEVQEVQQLNAEAAKEFQALVAAKTSQQQ